MRYFFVPFWVLLALYSCKKDTTKFIPQEEIIRIEFETDTSGLSADNETVVLLKAVIDPEAADAYRTITFAASEGLGTFQGTVTDDKNIVIADQTGVARTSIKVSNKPGTYYLSASVNANGKTYKSFDYLIRLQPVTQDNQIRLTFESDTSSLRADNQALISLKAAVSPNRSGETRTVTFTATSELGTFQGTGGTVTADEDGIARASIKVGDKPGVYFIAAEVKQGDKTYRTADYTVHLDPVPANEKLQLVTDDTKPEADGFSLIHITAITKFTKEKTVVVSTNLGAFLNSPDPKTITLMLDADGKAEVDLQISNVAKAHVIGAVLSSDASVVVTIVPTVSYPSQILVKPSGLSVAIGGSIDLNVFLRRNDPQKMVTQGIPVNFHAFQLISGVKKTVGRFTGLAQSISGADGSVPIVKFYADEAGMSAALPVFIEVSAPKNATENAIYPLEIKLDS